MILKHIVKSYNRNHFYEFILEFRMLNSYYEFIYEFSAMKIIVNS